MVKQAPRTSSRKVTSCLSCYRRKQKCNRRAPCNHCTQRRRPEQCIYLCSPTASDNSKASAGQPGSSKLLVAPGGGTGPPAFSDIAPAVGPGQQPKPAANSSTDSNTNIEAHTTLELGPTGLGNNPGGLTGYTQSETEVNHSFGLSQIFGYSEESNTNLLGLISHVETRGHSGSAVHDSHSFRTATLPEDSLVAVRREMAKMPARPILDFVLQFFLAEVTWMTQLIHPPSFMLYYDSWWAKQSPQLLDEDIQVTYIDFAVLILRTCAFAAQFLPSPTYTLDSIRGVPLSHLRELCNTVAVNLSAVAEEVSERGSLFRVQHLCFYAFYQACEGRLGSSWTMISDSIHVAHGLGYHKLTGGELSPGDPLEREMKRRVLCNLYVWDGLLSRQLDRLSSFRDSFTMNNLPRLHLNTEFDTEHDAPETFTERALQARLMVIWSTLKKSQGEDGAPYDPTQAQELHDRLQKDFIDTLPPAFSFTNPDFQWDEVLRHLAKQRQLVRATIGESICHLFRPLLRLDATQVRAMPVYKQVLLGSQTNALALAAFSILDASTKLHSLMGAMHTRLPAVVVYPFEAAVILALLCIKDVVPREADIGSTGLPPDFESRSNSARTGAASSIKDMVVTTQVGETENQLVSRESCIAAVEETLNSLQSLAEISVLAEGASRTLEQLLRKIHAMPPSGDIGAMSSTCATLLPSPWMTLGRSQHSFPLDPELSSSAWMSTSSGLQTASTAEKMSGTSEDTFDSDWATFELSLLNEPWNSVVQDGLLSD